MCASAIGVYGYDRGEVQLRESASKGGGFLSDVVTDWERARGLATAAGLRVLTVRTGVVQTPRGGTLRLMHPLFAAGLGGRLSIARILQRPALLPVPDIGPALLFGEQGARELATASQRRFPNRLIEAGHRFRRPTLEQCLRDQLGHRAGETP